MFQRIVLAFLLWVGFKTSECDAASKPNFIFVLADDLGGRDLVAEQTDFYDYMAVKNSARSCLLIARIADPDPSFVFQRRAVKR